MEDTGNSDEVRLKFQLVALRDIESGLENAMKTADVARAELREVNE